MLGETCSPWDLVTLCLHALWRRSVTGSKADTSPPSGALACASRQRLRTKTVLCLLTHTQTTHATRVCPRHAAAPIPCSTPHSPGSPHSPCRGRSWWDPWRPHPPLTLQPPSSPPAPGYTNRKRVSGSTGARHAPVKARDRTPHTLQEGSNRLSRAGPSQKGASIGRCCCAVLHCNAADTGALLHTAVWQTAQHNAQGRLE